jgi:hypoxanthine-DNA glycosylase
MVQHPIPPLYDGNSKILILGSFPSVKSREDGFFYAHPQNRFWKVIASVFDDCEPRTTAEKKELLHRNHIALWDVIQSCEITGSSDSSVKNVAPNDLTTILESSDIAKIFLNGRTSQKYYNKYTRNEVGREAVYLPSTSPANASWSLERLIDEWRIIRF